MSGLREKIIKAIKKLKNPGDGSIFPESSSRKIEPSPCFSKNRTVPFVPELVYRHRNTLFRFEFTLDSLIHPFSQTARDPDLSALAASPNRHAFKEIKVSLYQTVKRSFFSLQPAAALRAQRIFHGIHGIFSLLVLGSNHLAGSNQWTVII